MLSFVRDQARDIAFAAVIRYLGWAARRRARNALALRLRHFPIAVVGDALRLHDRGALINIEPCEIAGLEACIHAHHVPRTEENRLRVGGWTLAATVPVWGWCDAEQL